MSGTFFSQKWCQVKDVFYLQIFNIQHLQTIKPAMGLVIHYIHAIYRLPPNWEGGGGFKHFKNSQNVISMWSPCLKILLGCFCNDENI